MKNTKAKRYTASCRIIRADGTVKGTKYLNEDSYFTLETARKLVDRDNGERIYEYNGGSRLWEIF